MSFPSDQTIQDSKEKYIRPKNRRLDQKNKEELCVCTLSKIRKDRKSLTSIMCYLGNNSILLCVLLKVRFAEQSSFQGVIGAYLIQYMAYNMYKSHDIMHATLIMWEGINDSYRKLAITVTASKAVLMISNSISRHHLDEINCFVTDLAFLCCPCKRHFS